MNRTTNELQRQLADKQMVAIVGAGHAIAASRSDPIASWRGLLLDGLEYCAEYGRPRLSKDELDLCQHFIEVGAVDMMLAAATVIESRLSAPDDQRWRLWLKEGVGSLRTSDFELGSAIHGLNVPILTTNYDSLLGDTTSGTLFQHVTWRDTPQWIEILEGKRTGILHLHGWWDEPNSVVLGPRSYESVLRAQAAQEIQRALGSFNTLLFIGYGAGIDDPNFRPLLEWLQRRDAPNHRHYILLNTSEVKEHPEDSGLYPVEYGPTFEFLPRFLRSLSESSASEPGGVARDIVSLVPPGKEFSEAESPLVPRMVVIPSGSFNMGSRAGEDARPEELPVHEVQIDYRFAVSRYPITFDEWDAFVKASRGHDLSSRDAGWGRGLRPAINVNWFEAMEYIEWLNYLSSINGTYRLLSEAEWEYVARGGTNGRYWWGDDIDGSKANYDEADRRMTTLVDEYHSNPFGLDDLLGNTWEWTADCYYPGYKGAPVDGSARSGAATKRVVRGGCWYYDRDYLEAGARLGIDPQVRFNSIGFRVARTIRQPLEPDGRYAFISVNSGLAVTRLSDATVCQDVFSGKDSQVWELSEVDDATFILREPDGPLALRIADPADRNLSYAIVAKEGEGKDPSLHWIALPDGDGYMLESLRSGKVLDVSGISADPGEPLIQFARHGNANQRWWARRIL